MKKFVLSIALLICATLSVAASEDVAGTWSSVTVKKTWKTGLGYQLHGQYRSTDNLSRTDCAFFRGYLTYAPCPYFSTAVAYDLLLKPTTEQQDFLSVVLTTHRFLFDLNGQYAYKGWNFSLRERYVMSYSGTYGHLLRSYPQIAYRIKDTRFTPFVAAEFFNSIKPGDKFRLRETHLFAGTSFKVNDVHSFRFYYVMQMKHVAVPPAAERVHTIAVDYIVSLP